MSEHILWETIDEQKQKIELLENEKCELLGLIQGKDKAINELRDNYDQFKAIAISEREKLQKENAELEAQIETKDIQIKELQGQKCYWKESSFDWRHKFFKKGRIKQLIEKEKRIAELEKDRNYFSDALDKQIEATLDLQKENAELKEQLNFKTRFVKGEKAIDRLAQAMEIIRELLSWERRADYDYTEYDLIKDKAEQFLKEIKENENLC